MRTITIGDKELNQIEPEHLLGIISIEGCCPGFQFWDKPIFKEIDWTMFSDTVVIDYYSIRTSDKVRSRDYTFFFQYSDLSYHYHDNIRDENGQINSRGRGRIKMESIRYLIDKGYNVPL